MNLSLFFLLFTLLLICKNWSCSWFCSYTTFFITGRSLSSILLFPPPQELVFCVFVFQQVYGRRIIKNGSYIDYYSAGTGGFRLYISRTTCHPNKRNITTIIISLFAKILNYNNWLLLAYCFSNNRYILIIIISLFAKILNYNNWLL